MKLRDDNFVKESNFLSLMLLLQVAQLLFLVLDLRKLIKSPFLCSFILQTLGNQSLGQNQAKVKILEE